MLLVLLVALATLLALGFYFGLRVYGIFAYRGLRPPKLVFWPLLLAALVAMVWTRSPLICAVLYGVMLFALGDLAALILRAAPAAGQLLARLWQGGLTPLALALVITGLAIWNAHTPVQKSYTVTVDKDFEALTIVMVADMHLGTAVHEKDLQDFIGQVNSQSADIIALCGDIFEEGTPDALRRAAIAAFAGLEAAYGVYYITGNHDSTVPDRDDLEAAGVILLDNRLITQDGRFHIAGRQDGGHQGWSGRAPLSDFAAVTDSTLPFIVLDHRPGAWTESAASGADLQLSGHTHAGQLWPFGLFSRLANGINYGAYRQGGFTAVVTSGYGVWGFPARTAGRCEYVRIELVPQRP